VRIKLSKGAFLLTLIIALLMVSAISLFSISSSSAAPEGLTPRAPIYIEGNDSFTPANGVVGGSGTEDDPYIIENWDISAENDKGIFIRSTTAHFIVRNCYVHDGWAGDHYGIYFIDVRNGKIDNVTSDNNNSGIRLWYSSNNILDNNTYLNNYWGILLDSSSGNILSNNTCSNNHYGILQYFEHSINNTLSNNLVENNYYGIRISESDKNTLDNNIVKNSNEYGIYIYSANNNLVTNNIVGNNIHHGIYVHLGSSNNLVSNNTVENNGIGIRLLEAYNNLVSNNLVKNNQLYGVNCWYSDNNLILNNLVGNSYDGIRLVDSYNNLVSYNIMENNGNGIRLESSGNFIYHNNFVNNEDQAHDDGSNYWDNDYPSGGNYWSDYIGADADGDNIGDTPYSIPGDNNQDRYPLMNPTVPGVMLPEEAPQAPTRWPLIAGIAGVIVIIGVVAFYVGRR